MGLGCVWSCEIEGLGGAGVFLCFFFCRGQGGRLSRYCVILRGLLFGSGWASG